MSISQNQRREEKISNNSQRYKQNFEHALKQTRNRLFLKKMNQKPEKTKGLDMQNM